MKFGQGMDVDDPKVDLKGQGHRSKVKVTRSEKRDIWKRIAPRIMKFKAITGVKMPIHVCCFKKNRWAYVNI